MHATLEEPAETPAACREGCAHCCHFPVGARLAEVLQMVRAIADDPRLALRIQEEAEQTRDASWHDLAGRPCPLLRENACASYDVRPTPCRALRSFDAEACERSLREPTTVPRDEAAWWRGLGAASALDDGLGPRELRSALAAVLALGDEAAPEALAAAFAGARAVPGSEA